MYSAAASRQPCPQRSWQSARPLVKNKRPMSIQPENFNERDADRVVYVAHDRRIISRREGLHNRRFSVIGRRQTGGYNFGFLRAAPVIVGSDECAVGVVQLEEGI